MKTAVSLPDDVFEKADELARKVRKSRSRLYGDALREYIARHSPDDVTETLDRAIEAMGECRDPFLGLVSTRVLEQVEW